MSARLHPRIHFSGVDLVVIMEELAAVRVGSLGRVVGSAESYRYDIIAALDLLFTGI